LSLNEATGVISGIPETIDTFDFTVSATNRNTTGINMIALNIVIMESLIPPDGGTITLPGGAIAELPGGTMIEPDGTIRLPPGRGGTVTFHNGMFIYIPGWTVIDLYGTITPPAGDVCMVTSSDGRVTIEVSGNIRIGLDGTITLLSGATDKVTITTNNGTKIVLSSGKIADGPAGSLHRFLFIHVGQGGAEATLPSGSRQTYREGVAIRVNPDGTISDGGANNQPGYGSGGGGGGVLQPSGGLPAFPAGTTVTSAHVIQQTGSYTIAMQTATLPGSGTVTQQHHIAVITVTAPAGAVIHNIGTPPARDGFQFMGWYVDAAMTIPFNPLTMTLPPGTYLLYAKWGRSQWELFTFNPRTGG
jgi:uncharacterized repeat protein (TIGR02543 family)